MNKVTRMKRSRDSWKDKATARGEQLREFRKTKTRYQKRIERLQGRITTLDQQLSEEKKAPAVVVGK